MHGDQTHGINDLRVFYIKKKKQIQIYADKYTKIFKKYFSYCFKSFSKEYPATLKLIILKKNFQLMIKKRKYLLNLSS